ncbi:T30E16.11 [Arabidopsis thaliana]|uniref:T30E16.11 n=1 Tax=Arabidopsis thaliana TaxID=3702 RepID=Q9LQ60_ARATH|nr:T30E16.11 [Arabidopsis thaliana]
MSFNLLFCTSLLLFLCLYRELDSIVFLPFFTPICYILINIRIHPAVHGKRRFLFGFHIILECIICYLTKNINFYCC